jgi:glycosyltransferase involved in cell wall biosynthesis
MIGPDKGDGTLQATQALAVELGVAERIRFVGRIDKSEVPSWLDHADVFINTTNVDNTPVSVIEAMASGLCVVSTDVGGLPHLLEHGHDAVLVPADDAGRMAAAVAGILRDPERASRLSAAGRDKATRFDWSIVVPQWLALLESTAPAAVNRAPEPDIDGRRQRPVPE